MINYFAPEEFKCGCGCGRMVVNPKLVEKLNKAREFYDGPIHINSGYRCPEWNQQVGGKPDSAHLYGMATDLKCQNSRDRFSLINALLQAGFNRIGIATSFIHCDMDGTKPSGVIWLY